MSNIVVIHILLADDILCAFAVKALMGFNVY